MVDIINGEGEECWGTRVSASHCHNLLSCVSSCERPICSSLPTTSENRLDLFHDLPSNLPVWVFHGLFQLFLEALGHELFGELCKLILFVYSLGMHALYRTMPLQLIKQVEQKWPARSSIGRELHQKMLHLFLV